MERARPPIVTILGHVDHGKTTLLDYIRKTSVASKEHGGITQHIGAYQIKVKSQKSKVKTDEEELITFIDTPGHAAFEKMRSRGANVADIAVLVVAVDDGLMPQTTEAINHIKQAKIPMIVALNKIDLPGINLKVQMEKIKKQLSDKEVLIEEYGGDVPLVPISAKTGEGVDKLLEMILLMAELNEFKGDPDTKPSGVVIEANLDKFKGPVATLIIRNGSLKKGQQINIGGVKGKVRNLLDFSGKMIDIATPSMPVEVMGLEVVPAVGAVLGEEDKQGMKNEERGMSLIENLRKDKTNILRVIIKADKQGSLEAIESSLAKFNQEGEHIKIVFSGTGDITEKDVKMAAATKALVIGFNCKVAPTTQKLSESEHVLIRSYNIIYEMLKEVEDVIESMLKVDIFEQVFGTAQILAQFPYGKNEKIAGCRILDGQISKGSKVRLVRGEETFAEAKIKSLKKAKEEVIRVEKGDECGMIFDPPLDFQVGDRLQSFKKL